MRFSVEHQRNIAYDLLELDRKGISISEVFEDEEPIIIYGFDYIGREFYNRLCKKTHVICFIDKAHDGERYDDVCIYSPENKIVNDVVSRYSYIKVLVMILSDIKRIEFDLKKISSSLKIVSPYQILVKCKTQYDADFLKSFNKTTSDLIKAIIDDKTPTIDSIVIVGTTYTELLSIIYLKNWENALFVMERYIPEDVYVRMKGENLNCIYEKYAVQYYSLCYVIAEYARKWNIPIWGQDHMQLSRPFIENKINVVEDGAGNYWPEAQNQYLIILDDGRKYAPLGYDDFVTKVVLTGQFEVPELINGKAEIIKPADLWNKKDEKEKKFISKLFGFAYENLNIPSNAVLFLTEPTSSISDAAMTENEQIKIYKNILKNYKNYFICIKPHPADRINYIKNFQDCLVLDKCFPVQLIDWFNIKIAKVIVMKGSTCENLFAKKCEVDIYDGVLKVISESADYT